MKLNFGGVSKCCVYLRSFLLAVTVMVAFSTAWGKDFRAGPVEGFFDVTLSYGATYRVEDSDDALVGVGNGGESPNANADDGTLNYDRGLVSNMAAFNTELTLEYENFGVFVKTIGFYDWEQEEGDRLHRRFDARALDRMGSDIEVRDFFLSGKFNWGGVPWHIRVGDQVIDLLRQRDQHHRSLSQQYAAQ
jgi:hypothetical protein